MKAIDTIIKPVITEKATNLENQKIYCFWVNKRATKIDIKIALKEIYGADAEEVRIAYQRPKSRYMRKGVAEKRNEMKKAYVTLRNKTKLDLTKFEKESSKEAKVVKTPKVKTKTSKSTKSNS